MGRSFEGDRNAKKIESLRIVYALVSLGIARIAYLHLIGTHPLNPSTGALRLSPTHTLRQLRQLNLKSKI
ncbi:MAG: hypothetical protein AAGD25_26295 [Cyanobacteria bacterium P01_F01_bin.150]